MNSQKLGKSVRTIFFLLPQLPMPLVKKAAVCLLFPLSPRLMEISSTVRTVLLFLSPLLSSPLLSLYSILPFSFFSFRRRRINDTGAGR